MRKLVLGLALASTALATPAIARDKSWYVEGDLGGVITEKQSVTQKSNGSGVGSLVTAGLRCWRFGRLRFRQLPAGG